ncbi:hypothetical protein LguiA_035243 [Lonicera macranthoides]
MKWCYVGKATKIFILLITFIFITGLVLGFGFLRHAIHKTPCSSESCRQSSPLTPPNPNPSPPTSPDPNPSANNPPPPPDQNHGSTHYPPPPPPSLLQPPPPPPVAAAAPPQNLSPPFVAPGPMHSWMN